jgi:hypothetical protein
MKNLKVFVLLLFVVAAVAPAQKKSKKPVVPAVFGTARYVYVEAVDGNEFDPRVYPEDREAIANIENAIRSWGRYVLTMKRNEAELVFVVRKGRLLTAGGSVGVSHIPGGQVGGPTGGQVGSPGMGGDPSQQSSRFPGQQGQNSTELGAGAEAGPPDDLFEVCQHNGDGTLSSPLWEHQLEDGLGGPRPILFAQFKDAVDKAYPRTPAPQPPPPQKP